MEKMQGDPHPSIPQRARRGGFLFCHGLDSGFCLLTLHIREDEKEDAPTGTANRAAVWRLFAQRRKIGRAALSKAKRPDRARRTKTQALALP